MRFSNAGNHFAAQGLRQGTNSAVFPFSAIGSEDFEGNFNFGQGAPELNGNQGGRSGQNYLNKQAGNGRFSTVGNPFTEQSVQQTNSVESPFSAIGSEDLGGNFNFGNGAPERNGRPGQIVQGGRSVTNSKYTLLCPWGSVETCIKLCLVNTDLLYDGCVQGCADKC